MPAVRTAPPRRWATLCGIALALGILESMSAAQSFTESTVNGKNVKTTVYIGTYTRGKSKGIYRFELNSRTGKLTPAGVTSGVENPSFLAIHPNGKYLYSANETARFRGRKTGSVAAFRIDPKTGALAKLNERSSGGGGPCHLVVDPQGKNVLVANYGGGSVAVLPLEKDGRLEKASSFVQHTGSSVNPRRQKGPHAHSINVDRGNRFAVAADLGLDKLLVYKFDAGKGTLTANEPAFVATAPGAGPRHFAFHPNGQNAYVINELKLTVTAFDYDPQHGTLTPKQTISTLPKGYKGTGLSTAEVQVHPSGKFLYGSNRGHNSIAVFRIDQKSGRLAAVEHQPTGGKTPRNFGIDPSGRFLLAANQSSDSVVVFRIDQTTGALTPTGHKVEVPTPVCVKFLVR